MNVSFPMRGAAALRLSAAAVALALLAACGDDDPVRPGDDDHAEEVHAIRLTVGDQVVTVNEAGQVTGGPIVLDAGTSVALSAAFLDDDDDEVELGAEFELRIEPANTALVTFARTGRVTGTLTGVAPGQTSLQVILFHLTENHEEWEQPVTVTVQ